MCIRMPSQAEHKRHDGWGVGAPFVDYFNDYQVVVNENGLSGPFMAP